MSKKIIITGFGLFIIVLGLVYFLTNHTINHSTITSGQIISKEYNKDLKQPYIIYFKILSNDVPTRTKTIMIAAKDETTWNSVKEKGFYFVNYQWKNNDVPLLYQIEKNDKFGEINKDKFSN